MSRSLYVQSTGPSILGSARAKTKLYTRTVTGLKLFKTNGIVNGWYQPTLALCIYAWWL